MRAQNLLFLLLGAALGLALGLALGAGREERAVPRRTRTEPAPAAGRADATSVPPPEDRGTEAAPPPPGSTPQVPQPTSGLVLHRPTEHADPETLEVGLGRVEVDCRGLPDWTELRILGIGMEGEEKALDDSPDEDGYTRFDVAAGSYHIRWLPDDSLSERRLAVRVEAGMVTRVSAVAAGTSGESPIPSGLGRLDFEVVDIQGTPVDEANVEIHGLGMFGEEFRWALTRYRGWGRVHLRPGRYRIVIGAWSQQIDVVAGETTELRIRYRDEGEIHIEPPIPGEARLVRPEEKEAVWNDVGYFHHMEGSMRLLYVQPGRYVMLMDHRLENLPRRIGTVVVKKGKTTVFRSNLPSGGLLINLRADSEAEPGSPRFVTVQPVDREGESELLALETEFPVLRKRHEAFPGTARAIHLAPGRYRVRCEMGGYLAEERVVHVGASVVAVDLFLRPDPDFKPR